MTLQDDYNLILTEVLMLVEETVGEQKKRAAVVVGRFQPPTIGHYSVFDTVKKFIRKNADLKLDAVPIVVVIAGEKTSKDKTRNPLTASERISFMKASGKADGIRFIEAKSAFDAFEAVRASGFEPIAVASGSDRGGNYLKMLDTYFKSRDGSAIKHHSIVVSRLSEGTEKTKNEEELDNILAHMGEDIPVSMVSASLARRAVAKNAFKEFAIIVGLTHNENLATKLFNKIKKSIGVNDA
jgi:hypothetical protein